MTNLEKTFGYKTEKPKIKPRNTLSVERILSRFARKDKLDFETQSLLAKEVL